MSALASLSTSRRDKGIQLLEWLCSGEALAPNDKCWDAGHAQFARPLRLNPETVPPQALFQRVTRSEMFLSHVKLPTLVTSPSSPIRNAVSVAPS